jgi:hypothetical protein
MASTSALRGIIERFKEDLAKRKPEAIRGKSVPPKRKIPKLDATPRKSNESLN